ncbi:MAG TPA: hypothetical protein VGM22_05355 [Methylomirabilota bacterium]|jgi:hypothetical protein
MGRRLIVVAREEPDLFDYIRRDQFGDDSVVVIADRRRGDRRGAGRGHCPERRHQDRRQCDLEPLLRVHGWGEVLLTESEASGR